jgi:hypothetical protein
MKTSLNKSPQTDQQNGTRILTDDADESFP